METIVGVVREFLELMSPKDRAELMQTICFGYCVECGEALQETEASQERRSRLRAPGRDWSRLVTPQFVKHDHGAKS